MMNYIIATFLVFGFLFFTPLKLCFILFMKYKTGKAFQNIFVMLLFWGSFLYLIYFAAGIFLPYSLKKFTGLELFYPPGDAFIPLYMYATIITFVVFLVEFYYFIKVLVNKEKDTES